jgi:hypothetical protein
MLVQSKLLPPLSGLPHDVRCGRFCLAARLVHISSYGFLLCRAFALTGILLLDTGIRIVFSSQLADDVHFLLCLEFLYSTIKKENQQNFQKHSPAVLLELKALEFFAPVTFSFFLLFFSSFSSLLSFSASQLLISIPLRVFFVLFCGYFFL